MFTILTRLKIKLTVSWYEAQSLIHRKSRGTAALRMTMHSGCTGRVNQQCTIRYCEPHIVVATSASGWGKSMPQPSDTPRCCFQPLFFGLGHYPPSLKTREGCRAFLAKSRTCPGAWYSCHIMKTLPPPNELGTTMSFHHKASNCYHLEINKNKLNQHGRWVQLHRYSLERQKYTCENTSEKDIDCSVDLGSSQILPTSEVRAPWSPIKVH